MVLKVFICILKKIQISMIRANDSDDRKVIITRFLNDLNKDIVNMVELQHYLKIKDMVYMAIKVEKQLEKNIARPNGYLGFSQSWKLNFMRDDNVQTKPIIVPKVAEPLYVKNQVVVMEEKWRNNV